MNKSAVFSPCRTYRYELWRTWDDSLPFCAFIGLNPSTADETEDDPTIRRCVGFAKRWGFGGIVMLNMFGYRATDPKDLAKAENPHGCIVDNHEMNAYSVVANVQKAGKTICCWGCDPMVKKHERTFIRMLCAHELWDDLECLGKTKDGHPKHPLYLRGDSQSAPMSH